jgi:hypothetical protein
MRNETKIVEIELPSFNFRNSLNADLEELSNLQKQRTKANKVRKPYWQQKIDAHFGLN